MQADQEQRGAQRTQELARINTELKTDSVTTGENSISNSTLLIRRTLRISLTYSFSHFPNLRCIAILKILD